MQGHPLACDQAAKDAAQAAWLEQQPGDLDAVANLVKEVSKEESRQSMLCGSLGERKISAACTGSSAAWMILIKYIQSMLEVVRLPRTFNPPVQCLKTWSLLAGTGAHSTSSVRGWCARWVPLQH
jgi:hypothetical protein